MANRPWDVIGYLVDQHAQPARNRAARQFWQEFKAEALRRGIGAGAIARYRTDSRRIITALQQLPPSARIAQERVLWNRLIAPFGAHLDPGEYERVQTVLRTTVHDTLRALRIAQG